MFSHQALATGIRKLFEPKVKVLLDEVEKACEDMDPNRDALAENVVLGFLAISIGFAMGRLGNARAKEIVPGLVTKMLESISEEMDDVKSKEN